MHKYRTTSFSARNAVRTNTKNMKLRHCGRYCEICLANWSGKFGCPQQTKHKQQKHCKSFFTENNLAPINNESVRCKDIALMCCEVRVIKFALQRWRNWAAGNKLQNFQHNRAVRL